MAKSIGQIVRTGREEADLTREQLARKLKITPEYLGHIERNTPVAVSDRVVGELRKSLRSRVSDLTTALVERHNKRVASVRRSRSKA